MLFVLWYLKWTCVYTYQLTELMRNSKIIFRMEEQNRNCNTSYAIKKQIKIPSIARVLWPTYKFSLQCLVSNQQSIATNAWTQLYRVLDIVQCYALHNAVNEKEINITIFFSTLRVSCELRTLTLRACQKLYSACCIQGEGNYTYVVNKSMN